MKIQWQTISFSSIVGQKSIQSHFGWGATFSQVLLQVILHYLIYCTGLKFALMAYTLLWAESKWSVCNFSCSVMDSAALAAFYFPALKGIEKCARWPLKEEFHLLLAPCFSSVHFFFFFVMLSFPSMRNGWISDGNICLLIPINPLNFLVVFPVFGWDYLLALFTASPGHRGVILLACRYCIYTLTSLCVALWCHLGTNGRIKGINTPEFR